MEQVRRQQGGGRLTREDEQSVQDQVADQVIRNLLLEKAYGRLGITVADEEIVEPARSSPPPEILQQVLRDAQFQTNGQFDITKWQRYLVSADPQFRLQIEELYREYIPEQKLQQYLTSDIYESDTKLWRWGRDPRESGTGAGGAGGPGGIPHPLAPASGPDVGRYHTRRKNEFQQAASARFGYRVV